MQLYLQLQHKLSYWFCEFADSMRETSLTCLCILATGHCPPACSIRNCGHSLHSHMTHLYPYFSCNWLGWNNLQSFFYTSTVRGVNCVCMLTECVYLMFTFWFNLCNRWLKLLAQVTVALWKENSHTQKSIVTSSIRINIQRVKELKRTRVKREVETRE